MDNSFLSLNNFAYLKGLRGVAVASVPSQVLLLPRRHQPQVNHSHPTFSCLLGSSTLGVTGGGQCVFGLHIPPSRPDFIKVLARLDRAGEGNAGRVDLPPCASSDFPVMPLREDAPVSWIRRDGLGISPPMKLNTLPSPSGDSNA